MSSARVHSVQTLKDVKAAVADFTDAVNRTLTSVDADINRIQQWLTQDRPAYWNAQIRRRQDEVNKAQADIMRKRIIAAPEPASIIEEQKAMDKAKRKLAYAQEKLQNVRRWAPVWEREALLYKTACRGLAETVHRDMPRAGARLDSLMTSLEEYLKIAVPRAEGEIAPALDANQPEGIETPPEPKAAPEETP